MAPEQRDKVACSGAAFHQAEQGRGVCWGASRLPHHVSQISLARMFVYLLLVPRCSPRSLKWLYFNSKYLINIQVNFPLISVSPQNAARISQVSGSQQHLFAYFIAIHHSWKTLTPYYFRGWLL